VSPDRDPTAEALASYLAWRLQMGKTWEEAMTEMRERFPGEDPRLYEDARQTAEGLVIVADRLRNADPEELMIDIYQNTDVSGPNVGVRYAIEFQTAQGRPDWKTVAINAPLIWTKQQVEEEVRRKAIEAFGTGQDSSITMVMVSGEPSAVLLNVLSAPLPERQS